MMQASLMVDRHAAGCGGSARSNDPVRRGGLPAIARSILNVLGRDRMRTQAPDPLSDHLLQDIGLNRADLQALWL